MEEKEVKEHQEVEEVGGHAANHSGEASICHKVLHWFFKLGIMS